MDPLRKDPWNTRGSFVKAPMAVPFGALAIELSCFTVPFAVLKGYCSQFGFTSDIPDASVPNAEGYLPNEV